MGCNLGSGGIFSAMEDMSGAFQHVWTGLVDACLDALSVLPFNCPYVHRFCPQKILEFVLESSPAALLSGGRYESCLIWNRNHSSCLFRYSCVSVSDNVLLLVSVFWVRYRP